MRHFLIKPTSRWAVLIGVLLFAAVTMTAAKRDSNANKAVPVDQKTAQADPSQYVGSDTCKGCHEDAGKSIEASPHFKIGASKKIRGEAVHGCESCHGPGAAHVEGGGDKTKIFNFKGAKPDQITKRCMTCHESNPEQREFVRSTHNENGITCTSCHSVHHSKLEYQLVKKQTPLCFSCHAEQKADFQKPFHHRVEEGLIQCGDCHNAHGALKARQLRATPDQDAVCFKCHSDKRGPFVFEHEPIKVEGCTACHFPHGSTNPRMLTTARANSLCLQCHAATAQIGHTQNTRIQQCIACHSSIHGSNLSPVFFK
jgi:DmsE family decaheme c-type cytochrome